MVLPEVSTTVVDCAITVEQIDISAITSSFFMLDLDSISNVVIEHLNHIWLFFI